MSTDLSEEISGGLTEQIAAFLKTIGIPVVVGEVPRDTFLPGILVHQGGLVVDPRTLLYPGDLLHEAGHLAFAPASLRRSLSGEVVIPGVSAEVVEVQAICWSYAACLYLTIDPAFVFHPDGYHGRSESILLNFRLGNYLGLPGLEAAGMAFSPVKALERGVEPFPVMQKWLAD